MLVCLYSGRYFSSEGCGKELAAFDWRLKQKWGQAGKPPLILPVLWERPSEILKNRQQYVKDLQEKNKDLGTDYVQEGLEYLIRLERGAEYLRFLMAFGSRLVAVATQHQLNDSDSIPAWTKLVNPFQAATDAAVVQAQEVNLGPGVAQFIFAAGAQADFQELLQGFYGPVRGRTWKPYGPKLDKPMGVVATGVAASLSMEYQYVDVPDDLAVYIRDAEKSNTVVLVIVDPRTVNVGLYRNPLQGLDGQLFQNCEVLVIWNSEQPQTAQQIEDLQNGIKEVFENFSEYSPPTFRNSIDSPEELMNQMSAAIKACLQRLIKRSKPARPVPPGSTRPVARII